MFGPIAEPANVAHEISRRRVLMVRDEIADSIIQIKCSCNDNGGNDNADQPVKKSSALHNRVPVGFVGRYFETAFEISNSQLHPVIFWMRGLSRDWDVERSVDRSGRT